MVFNKSVRRLSNRKALPRGLSTMTTPRSLSLLFILALFGCGSESKISERNFAASAAKAAHGEELMASAVDAPTMRVEMAGEKSKGTDAALVALQTGLNLPPGVSAPIARKIIYDAQVDLVVESVDPVAKKVGTLVQDARGYIAEQTVAGSPGSQRSMHWRFRIPVEQFDSFAEAIVALGELERNNRTSQDVTEQYYDIEARIKNKRVEEQTLNKILQERSGKLEDVLKIEIELSRVRGEIEQLEGKIRVLENLASLATLTLNIRERDKFAPPAPVVADFRTQISRTWDGSLLDLVNLGKAFVLWAVGWAIWIPFLLASALIAWVLGRWLLRVFIRNLPRLVALARTPIVAPRTPTTGG
jgi:Domain of unknown function (DUF4349)